MNITYDKLKKVTFPVYIVPKGNWSKVDGLLLLDDRIMDDTNMPGSSMGIRRMQTHTALKDLVPVKKAIVNYAGIFKNSANNSYIDSTGIPFVYTRTRFSKLKSYKIRKIERKEVASVLWVNGLDAPFTLIRPPESGMAWVSILHLGSFPWVVYGFSEERLPDARKKI